MTETSVRTKSAPHTKEPVQIPHDAGEPDASIMVAWDQVMGRLRQDYDEAVYRSWLKPLDVRAFYQNALEVSVPTRFMKDWIQSNYLARMIDLCHAAHPDIHTIQLIVPTQTLSGSETAKTVAPQTQVAEGETAYAEWTSPLDPRFTFETFVVGKPNAFAQAAARRVVESDKMPFNPFYLYGGVGLGKTHLMHAIAWELRQKRKLKVAYLSAEQFMYQFVKALRRQDSMQFKEQFRGLDVLMIDDIQFIAGKETTQQEFFHTFNALVDQGKMIIISGDRAPTELEGLDERLRSRLSWGLVADIKPSSFDLRLDIVKMKSNLLKCELPQDVAVFLAGKIAANIRELEGALNRLAIHRDMTGQVLNLDVAQEALADVLKAYDRRITIDEIQRRVAEHYNMKLADMHSPRRMRQLARPRQVAMYLCKKLTTRSLPEIGRKFGGRDHTTVMHAVKKVEELMVDDTSFADEVETVRRLLKAE